MNELSRVTPVMPEEPRILEYPDPYITGSWANVGQSNKFVLLQIETVGGGTYEIEVLESEAVIFIYEWRKSNQKIQIRQYVFYGQHICVMWIREL